MFSIYEHFQSIKLFLLIWEKSPWLRDSHWKSLPLRLGPLCNRVKSGFQPKRSTLYWTVNLLELRHWTLNICCLLDFTTFLSSPPFLKKQNRKTRNQTKKNNKLKLKNMFSDSCVSSLKKFRDRVSQKRGECQFLTKIRKCGRVEKGQRN